jgi:glycosyltransferase involved in cell wall biosynthesis
MDSQQLATVSAIITSYNYGRFLGAALESVLSQTYPAHEIIVVDDGSTDDTAQVAARYAGRGVRYLYQENRGASAARNLGIRNSSGALIAFLDADDRWLPEKLEKQARHLRAHPEVGFVTGGEWEVDDSGARPPWLLLRESFDSRTIYPRILIENMVGSTSLVMVRRECLEWVGLFDEKIPLGQDWDLWIRLAKEYPAACLSVPLMKYRRHGASLSAASIWRRYFSNRTFQRRHIRPIHNLRLRVQLLLSAQSMNLFYTAASLSEEAGHFGPTYALAYALALLSVLLGPAYQARLKWGLLARLLLGENLSRKMHSILHPGGARHAA